MKRKLAIGLAVIMLLALVPSVAVAGNGGPEGSLTGGGQITNNGYKLSFAGNVGLMEDESLVGHWQTHFHNVSVDSLDKTKFRSTSITLLNFWYCDEFIKTQLPSAVGANVVHFIAEGRLNGEDGYSLDVWLADRGEPGTMVDSIWMALWYGGEELYLTMTDFPDDGQDATLIRGNFQIHPGIEAE